ncbi:MAG: TonB-dependent receptor plug domain-containing protein [Bacteroidetes bacterium]|nr:TonB-dependent receptor plug domain-containing protein [Bacteroidota bacterium]
MKLQRGDSIRVQRADSALIQRRDSTGAHHFDSTLAAHSDTTFARRPDSLGQWDLHTWAGSVTLSTDTAHTLTATQLEWLVPVSIGHAVATMPGVYIADQASIGQYLRPTMRGVDWRGIGITIDGIPAADPATNMLNLSAIPISMADRIEVVTGPRSFLFGLGAVGGTINIVTRRASHPLPFTRIRYSEAGYGYAYSDGLANMDISRRFNADLGYQFQGTEGRYDNSGHEQWNIRSNLRYHVAEEWDITLSHLYTQSRTGLNDGIDPDAGGLSFAFQPNLATVRNTDAYEKITRHDLALKIAGSFWGDSTNLTSFAVFTSHLLREYRDEETGTIPNGFFLKQDHKTSRSGASLRQRFRAGPQMIVAGVQAEEDRIVESPTLGSRRNPAVSGWLLDEIAFSSGLVWSLFGRLDHIRGKTHSGFGSDLTIRFGDVITVQGGLSVSHRPGTYAELFWTDSTVFRSDLPAQERHIQGEIGARWEFGEHAHARLVYAYRTVRDPILFSVVSASDLRPKIQLSRGDKLQIHSVELSLGFRIGFIMVEGTGTYIRQTDASGIEAKEIPPLQARGGVYFRDRILGGALDLQAGVRAQARTGFDGSTILGETLFPLQNARARIGMASALDLVLVARLGDAYIHFLWENITDATYFTTPFTPALDRNIRFGVSWEFTN